MSSTSIMKVTGNGQVSIPAATRSRWNAERVIVVDLGDRGVMRPLPDDQVRDLRGKYKDRLPTSDSIRQEDRQLDAADEAGE